MLPVLKLSKAEAAASLLLPPFGVVTWAINRKTDPGKAKQAAILAITGIAAGILINVAVKKKL